MLRIGKFTETENLFQKKDFVSAIKLQENLHNFIKTLFLEVNPIPVKAALWHLGLCRNELRLPLTKMSKVNFECLKKELEIVIGKDYDCL